MSKEDISEDVRGALDAARAAIIDAIMCEDGLDGATGEHIVKWITDIIGDCEECHRLEKLADST